MSEKRAIKGKGIKLLDLNPTYETIAELSAGLRYRAAISEYTNISDLEVLAQDADKIIAQAAQRTLDDLAEEA